MKDNQEKTESFKKAMAERKPFDEARYYEDEQSEIGGEEELAEDEDDEVIEEEDFYGDED